MKFEYKESGNGYLVTISYTNQKIDSSTTQKTTKEKIIDYLREDSKLTREELAKTIGVSANAIKQHLANLQKENRLKRVGGRKSGYWEINKNFKVED
jgi:ATP-dependent DNA helicase RecG